MSNSQWNSDQSIGERTLREYKRRTELDSKLGESLRAIGIDSADSFTVQVLYVASEKSASHWVVSVLRAVEMWLRHGGAL